MHVLVADDNAINRQYLRAVFEGQGDQVSEAENGAEAIEACRQQEFDIILMDIRMPEINGIEATNSIRRELADPPVIVALTADMNAQEKEQLLERGFAVCLTKPISKDELLGAVTRCLGGGKPRRGHRLGYNEPSDDPIDRAAALAAAAGSPELVAKLTAMLTKELETFGPRLKQFIAQQDYDDARELAHKLRASTGYCGALPLQRKAANLETALKQKQTDEISTEHQRFESELDRLKAFLHAQGQDS